MNPPSREIRVLFVPPGSGWGGIADFPADTLDILENSSPFPRVPCTSAPRFTLGVHARTHTTSALPFSHSGFHSLEISRSQYALTTPCNQQRLIPSRLFAYVSHDEQGDENAVAASGGNQGDSCSRMRRGITAMILRASDKQRKRARYYMSHE